MKQEFRVEQIRWEEVDTTLIFVSDSEPGARLWIEANKRTKPEHTEWIIVPSPI